MKLCVIVLLVASTAPRHATLAEEANGRHFGATDDDRKIVVRMESPNLKLTEGKMLICSSARIPVDSGFIVGIRPKPILGTPYHLNVFLCDEPGFRPTDGSDGVWECGNKGLAGRSSFLPNAPECLTDNRRFFDFQYQSGPPDDSSFHLPHGTGFPVGDGTAFHTIVSMYHFYKPEALINGSTAGSAVEVTLIRKPSDREITAVSGMQILSHGFVGANSVGSVSGSWTLEDETVMDLLLLYTHWHEMAIDVVVWIERMSGERDVLLRQDPHSFSGITDVSNVTSAVMREGDRLTIECAFNNTMDVNLRVETIEMCALTTYYTTDGQDLTSDPITVSIDPFYKECLSKFEELFEGTSVNYEGRSSFHGSSAKDCL